MNDKYEEAERQLLLQELETELGILPNGRKARADKGKPRQTYANQPTLSKEQKANAQTTPKRKETPSAIYKRVKNRLFNQGTEISHQLDQNGIYIVIPEAFKKEVGEFSHVAKGQKNTSQVRYVRTSREIDLEYYRWDSMFEKAASNELVGVTFELTSMLKARFGMSHQEAVNAIMSRPTYNYKEFIKDLYYLDDYYEEWTYEEWRSHYEITPREVLPESFVFNKEHKPGTKEFHPEWAYRLNDLQEQKIQEEQEARERRSWNAKISKRPNK